MRRDDERPLAGELRQRRIEHAHAGGVGASVVDGPGRYLGFLAVYDAIFALVCWASFEYVVTE